MLNDARDLPPGSTLHADICIVGGGPAGLTLALELTRRGREVMLLEGGGTEPDAAAQSLSGGETAGDRFPALEETRWRELGGAAHLWNSQHGAGTGFRGAPLDPIDFEEREWIPGSGWPFGREELEPFYRRAQELLELGPFAYRGADWQRAADPPLPLNASSCVTSVWLFARQQRITVEMRQEVLDSPRAEVWLHANVTRLQPDGASTAVASVHASTPEGVPFQVRARTVILAAGGIENARLLLLSEGARPGGIGNEHGQVGRGFMEHQVAAGGVLTPRNRALLDAAGLYDQRSVNGATVMGQIQFSEDLMRRERLANLSFALYPRHPRHHRIRTQAIHSFEALAGALIRRRMPEDGGKHVREVIRGLDYVLASIVRKASGQRLFPYFVPGPELVHGAGWSNLPDKQRRFGAFEVLIHAEQLPHPDNRITLSDEKDRLGCRRARLEWRWRDADRANVARAQQLFAAEVERSGIGSYAPDLDADGGPRLRHAGLHHHMGTTRMHTDPRHGVVDAHGRVHGMENLYIAGCSVFPTGGFINPTLTIVALAIRMAERLNSTTSPDLHRPTETAA